MSATEPPRPRDPLSFFLSLGLLASIACLAGVLYFAGLQVSVVPDVPGRLAGIQQKLRSLLPLASLAGLLLFSACAAFGWWRLLRRGRGAVLLGLSLLGLLGLSIGLRLQMIAITHSMEAARLDARDARQAHEDFRAYTVSDIARQREALRAELADSDKLKAQANRILRQLKGEDQAVLDRKELVENLQKLHQNLRGEAMSYPEMVALEQRIEQAYGGKPVRVVAQPTPVATPKPGPAYRELAVVPTPTPAPRPVPTPVPPVLPGSGYVNETGGYSTRFPEGWRVSDTGLDGAVVASSPLQDPRNPVRATVAVLLREAAASPTAVLDAYLETFAASVTDYQEQQRGAMPMPAGQAAFVRCSFTQLGQATTAILIATQAGAKGFVLNCSAPTDRFGGFETDFMLPVAYFRPVAP